MSFHTTQMNQSTPASAQRQPSYSTAYLVDEQGREVQITEHMIQRACQVLRQRCSHPKQM